LGFELNPQVILLAIMPRSFRLAEKQRGFSARLPNLSTASPHFLFDDWTGQNYFSD